MAKKPALPVEVREPFEDDEVRIVYRPGTKMGFENDGAGATYRGQSTHTVEGGSAIAQGLTQDTAVARLRALFPVRDFRIHDKPDGRRTPLPQGDNFYGWRWD